MANSILVLLNDSVSSRRVMDFLVDNSLCLDGHITLLHVFRKPSAGEELMGRKFMEELPKRFITLLENARTRLINERGVDPDMITVKLLEGNYPTVTDGVIDFFNKGSFDMVVIGRKRMSKSEEFIRGDISIKLIRALENTAILVIKS